MIFRLSDSELPIAPENIDEYYKGRLRKNGVRRRWKVKDITFNGRKYHSYTEAEDVIEEWIESLRED